MLTCREIAEALGISTSNTYRNVKFFEDKRLLTTTTKGNSVTTTRMRDMFYDEIAIQGVAVKVIKDLEE